MTDKNKPDAPAATVSGENTPPPGPPAITTVQGLAAAYPALIEELRVMTCRLIENQTAAEFAQRFPALHGRILKALNTTLGTNFGAVGFPLAVDDPFAAGALRVYAHEACYQDMVLPAILPWKDPATRPALESYLLRARGGGDTVRARAAEEALTKTKK